MSVQIRGDQARIKRRVNLLPRASSLETKLSLMVSTYKNNITWMSVSCKIIYIILQSKPILFDFCLNLSVETSTRSNKQRVRNQSEAMKNSGLGQPRPHGFFKGKALGTRLSLGLGFLARDKVKLKRLLSRLPLEFQGEVLFCFI